jgi:hypothetical protein
MLVLHASDAGAMVHGKPISIKIRFFETSETFRDFLSKTAPVSGDGSAYGVSPCFRGRPELLLYFQIPFLNNHGKSPRVCTEYGQHGDD